MAKWVSDKNAVPPLHHDLVEGRKTIGMIRRVMPRKTKGGYRYSYQVVNRIVDIMGSAVGPVFPTLAAAKRHIEGRL